MESEGLSGWLWGCEPAFAWRALGGSGIYAAACVIPKAKRISRPLFSAGTSLFFKSMVTYF